MTQSSHHQARYAELIFRRYARETNQLVAGTRHAVIGGDPQHAALADALRSMGAHVRQFATVHDAAAWPHTITHAGTASYLEGRARSTAAERIAWATDHMPVVATLARDLAENQRIAGLKIGMCLVLEPKTAVLALTLAAAGAQVSVYAHPEETDAQIAAELANRGITVFADATANPDRAQELMDEFLNQHLNLLIDDGARVIRRAHHVAGALDELIGAAEETTSGLRNLAKEPGGPRVPVIAVNNARSKTWFDNAVGTGQSCVSTILDIIDPGQDGWSIVGADVVVAGYGPVGRGFARHVRALGGLVTVVDTDPTCALRAEIDGYQVRASLVEAVATADLIVSATGYAATITPDMLRAARPGAYIAVAGGVDDEVQWGDAIRHDGATWEPVGFALESLRYPNGHHVNILDRGGCINCTAGEGNPIEIMDLSFGVQLSALDVLLTRGRDLGPGVHPIPERADQRVSAIALAQFVHTADAHSTASTDTDVRPGIGRPSL